MRTHAAAAESRGVRVLLDIRRDGDGRVVGRLALPGGAPVRFSGWLELLHLLEGHADDGSPEEGTD
jgi:hypothetical protein